MRRLMLALMLLIPNSVPADDEGRYQMMLVQEGGAADGGNFQLPRVLVLDTEEGHLWTWGTEFEARDRARQKIRTITYQGRLRPGARPGEVISRSAAP